MIAGGNPFCAAPFSRVLSRAKAPTRNDEARLHGFTPLGSTFPSSVRA